MKVLSALSSLRQTAFSLLDQEQGGGFLAVTQEGEEVGRGAQEGGTEVYWRPPLCSVFHTESISRMLLPPFYNQRNGGSGK